MQVTAPGRMQDPHSEECFHAGIFASPQGIEALNEALTNENRRLKAENTAISALKVTLEAKLDGAMAENEVRRVATHHTRLLASVCVCV